MIRLFQYTAHLIFMNELEGELNPQPHVDVDVDVDVETERNDTKQKRHISNF